MVKTYCICEKSHQTSDLTMKAEIDYYISASGVINVTKARCIPCNKEHIVDYRGVYLYGRVVDFDYFRYQEDK